MFVTDKTCLINDEISFKDRAKQLQEIRDAEEQAEREKRKSHFLKFTQSNDDEHSYIADDWIVGKSPIAYRIFKFLVHNMDEYNAVVCSYKVLQEQFKISPDTVRRGIKVLKESGYIAVLKSGVSNVYAINDDLYWKSWGNNRKYSKFPANVILSLSEQEEAVKLKNIKHKEITIKE